ncbi:hypothetical protein ACFE04_006868 [Oxalis oulophora]
MLSSLCLLPLSSSSSSKQDYNSLIKHQATLKNDNAILSTYTQMLSLNISPNTTTLPLVIKACSRLNAVQFANRLHLSIKGTNFIKDVRVATALIDFYCKSGFIEQACNVFDEMRDRDLVTWNAMINGFVENGRWEQGFLVFIQMGKLGFRPNSRTLVALVKACKEGLAFRLGKEIHGYCLRKGFLDFGLNTHVTTALVGFYSIFDIRMAQRVFDFMMVKSVVSWNAMITSYFQLGASWEALSVFKRMVIDEVEIDRVTLLVVIQASAVVGCFKIAMQVHNIAIKLNYVHDLFIVNALVNMYSEIGYIELARKLFDSNPTTDIALWNSMLSSYSENGFLEEAVILFAKMRTEGFSENEGTAIIMLSLCAKLLCGLLKGKSIHAHIIKSRMEIDISMGNALLSMYEELGCIESAMTIFLEMGDVDVISYNIMILALARNSMIGEALDFYKLMHETGIEPNFYTLISLLSACEEGTFLNVGKSIHGYAIKQGIEKNISFNTALIDMYMNCGDEEISLKLFEGYKSKDVISWNALIASCIRNNKADKAMFLFNRMIVEWEPNSVTIINILSSCTHLANLSLGQCLHAYTIRRWTTNFGFFNLSLANSFITMYARCGSLTYAEKIFGNLSKKDTISWNAMITGYGIQGRAVDAFLIFSQMLADGFRPNGITFVSLLSTCSHCGLISEGLHLFNSMIWDFNVIPELSHYGCVVDLLGRGGRLDEAMEFVKLMPIKPDASIWRALLSAFRDNPNIEQVENIFEKLIKLEPNNAGNFVLLSNIYAAAGLWSEVRWIRKWLRENGLKKPAGVSWIVVRNRIHSFTAGDTSHYESDKIYGMLSSQLISLKEAGFVPSFLSESSSIEVYAEVF